MKDLFKNKKTLIPIIIGVLIIIVAIVIFVIITVSNKKSNGRVSTVKLSNETQNTSNELGNTYPSNNTSNEIQTSTDELVVVIDGEFDNIDDAYREAIETFMKGLADSDEMQDFLDNHFDPKACVAYGNIDGDESKFLEEYENTADDDSNITTLTETLLNMPELMQGMVGLINSMSTMDGGNFTDGNGTEIDPEDLDFTVRVTDMDDPEVSDKDGNISKITMTFEMMGEESKYIFVFYGDIVIYIMDENGNSILESSFVEE